MNKKKLHAPTIKSSLIILSIILIILLYKTSLFDDKTITIELVNESSRDNVFKTMDILEKRAQIYGIKIDIRPVETKGKHYIKIKTRNCSKEELQQLVEQQGKFEATIDRKIIIKNDIFEFKLNNKSYNIEYLSGENKLKINNNTLKINDTIKLENITIKYINNINNAIYLKALIIENKDIKQIYWDSRHSRITGKENKWQFRFVILISNESANRFAKITKDISTETIDGREYLSDSIKFYLDNELVDNLKISSDLKGIAQTSILIGGPGNSKEDAIINMRRLQAILGSDKLPTEIKIV